MNLYVCYFPLKKTFGSLPLKKEYWILFRKKKKTEVLNHYVCFFLRKKKKTDAHLVSSNLGYYFSQLCTEIKIEVLNH